MWQSVAVNVGLSVIFMVVGGVIGVLLVIASTRLLPVLIQRMTPNIDEDKEILRGNTAVAEYHGRVVAASIIGVSIVIAAAVIAGIMAALHG